MWAATANRAASGAHGGWEQASRHRKSLKPRHLWEGNVGGAASIAWRPPPPPSSLERLRKTPWTNSSMFPAGLFSLTGASSAGLGRQFALTLAGRGATVALAARRESALRELAAEIEKAGGKAHAVRIDVTDLGSVKAGVAEAVRLAGPIDGLINNSGTAERVPLLEETRGKPGPGARHQSQRRLGGRRRSRKARGLDQGKGGSIVNIASLLWSASGTRHHRDAGPEGGCSSSAPSRWRWKLRATHCGRCDCARRS